MNADASQPESSVPAARWIEVPLRKNGFLARLCELIFHLSVLALCAACIAFLVMVARDKADPAPSQIMRKYLASPALPITQLIATVLAGIFGYVSLVRLLDAILPVVTFEGDIASLESKSAWGLRTNVRVWVIFSGTQRWQIPCTSTPEDFSEQFAVGKKIRVVHSAVGRKVVRLSVAADT